MPPNDPPKPAAPTAPVSDTAKLIREILGEMLPALAVAQGNNNRSTAPRPAPMLVRCQECGQFEDACKGKHTTMVVYPASRLAQKFFTGVYINGVNYRSHGHSDPIIVPAQNSIRQIMETFESNEEDLSQGRPALHHSGTFGKDFHPPTQAWR